MSTCVLSPTSATAAGTEIHHQHQHQQSSHQIHPALRPSTMQQQQQQEYHNQNSGVSASSMDADAYQSANELLHDTVTLLSGNKGPTRVILSVFRTTADHFALVYPDNRRKAVAIKPAGCINLRSVTCEETTLGSGLKGFTLRPKKCDTSSAALTFICSDASLLPKFMEALSSPNTTNGSPTANNGAVKGSTGLKRTTATHFSTGPPTEFEEIEEPQPVYYRRTSPRLSSLSSLDEEDEEYDEE